MEKKFILKSMVVAIIFIFVAGGEIVFSSSKANAQQLGPIKIGAPVSLSGHYNLWGVTIKRALEFVMKETNEKGGVLGRKIEILFEEAGSDPATCLRKVRKLVEHDKVKILTGITGSDQVAAILGQLAQWDVLYVANVNGAGSLTASQYTPYMVRAGGTAPMASRTIRLYIEDSPTKRFMGIASDYVYGHSALDSFEKEIKDLGRQYLGNIYAPLNTKDFSSYIARIKKEKPEILYVALIGDDIHNFFRQAKGYGLLEEVQPMFEQIYLFYVLPLGDLLVGVIGSTRYTCTFDNPENKKFVQKFYSAFKEYPDIPDGEVYHSMGMLFKAIEKAGTADDVQAIIKAYEGLEYTGIKGRVVMRACDHQATNPGVMVKLIKSPDYPHPIPQVIKVYPGEKVIPSCRKETFD